MMTDTATTAAATEPYVPRGAVLVTGGAGFIGSHLVAALLGERGDHADVADPPAVAAAAEALSGCRVVVLDTLGGPASAPALATLQARHPNRLVVERGDILDPKRVGGLLRDHGIDTVLHLAAHTHVDLSFCNSLAFTMVNTLGTHVLLEACREYGAVRRFVYQSTDEVYGGESDVGAVDPDYDGDTDGATRTTERAALAPTNPYAAAKAAAEMQCLAYRSSYNMPVLITRCNNAYGPGQLPEK